MNETYYFGDTITFSGTNTFSGTTYLFITGPNMKENGSRIQSSDPRHFGVTDGDASTFLAAGVGPDNQWSWTWDTHTCAIDAGTYTVYAAGAPRDKFHINSTVYNTTIIIFARPRLSVTVQPEDPQVGDIITISGTAKGHPGPGVALWVIGPAYSDRFVVTPDSYGAYSLDIDSAAAGMGEGYYRVLLQHPSFNDVFDIFPVGDWVYNNETHMNLFRLRGQGYLRGDDAYEALVQAFWSPYVDDQIPMSDDWEPVPAAFHLSATEPSVPVVSFSGIPFTGPAPLKVAFADGSRGGPTGWAWYFGDETYSQPWTLVNASPGWEGRVYHSSVALRDGSMLLMGGYLLHEMMNDTWRSTDNGATWMLVNASSGWGARGGHSSIVLQDGSIVLMGGYEGDINVKNDTWLSTDNGATWILMNASPGWSPRFYHSSVALPDGSIVLTGGYCYGGCNGDVWRSTDRGATWTLVNGSPGWSGRYGHDTVAMPDGSIVLVGGTGVSPMNDTWRSDDRGASWTLVNASSGWSARSGESIVGMPDGSILLAGGADDTGLLDDIWRSTDAGATWTRVNPAAGWPARNGHSCVVTADGSIVLTGGETSSLPLTYESDVWRVRPFGSSSQDPVHTYSAPGTYTVALQASNDVGYNSKIRSEYITVTPHETVHKVTSISVVPPGNMGSGTPVTALFSIDFSSTGSETFPPGSILRLSTDLDNARWNYTLILDGVETKQPGSGGQTLNLSGWILAYPAEIEESLRVTLEGTAPSVSSPYERTVFNVTEFNSHGDPDMSTRFSRTALVRPHARPVAYFAGAPRTGAAPLTVRFTDTSANIPASWKWTFGDGSPVNSTLKSPVHTYSRPGTYTVSLNVSNAVGFNKAIKTGYIIVKEPVPVVSSIAPAAGIRGRLVRITNLSGTGFAPGAKVSLNRTGYPLINATNVSVASAKKITCTIKIPADAPLGLRKVDVKNTNGRHGAKARAFMVKAPAAPTVTSSGREPGNRADSSG
jgi:PKD repeat protein